MRMSRKQEIIALPGGHREDVGIVREQDVDCAGHDQALGAAQVLLFFVQGLVIHAGQIQRRIAEAELPAWPRRKRMPARAPASAV